MINFNMEDDDFDIASMLIKVANDCYVLPTTKIHTSTRFRIPKTLVEQLDLKASDPCFFVHYQNGWCLYFKKLPEEAPRKRCKMRQLNAQGQHNTLYLVIPPAVKEFFASEITNVKLMHIAKREETEWNIEFLTTD